MNGLACSHAAFIQSIHPIIYLVCPLTIYLIITHYMCATARLAIIGLLRLFTAFILSLICVCICRCLSHCQIVDIDVTRPSGL